MENKQEEVKKKSFKEKFLSVGAVWKAKEGSKKDYIKISFDKKLKDDDKMIQRILKSPSLVGWSNPYKKEGDKRPNYNLFVDTDTIQID